jgi:hypothetical protein
LPSHAGLTAALTLALGFSLACDHATGIPSDDPVRPADSQPAPFRRGSQSDGNPTFGPPRSAANRLPVGTPLTIRLLAAISSGSSHAGDTFQGRLDEPVVVEDQELAPRGLALTGRVLAAKATGGPHDPGYLRIALVALNIDNKWVSVETSSLFAKGGVHGGRGLDSTKHGMAPGAAQQDVAFSAERRLTFRLAQAVELP